MRSVSQGQNKQHQVMAAALVADDLSPGTCSALTTALSEHLSVFATLERERGLLFSIAARMAATLQAGGKILFCGNGGSAADAQHLAAELVGRFRQPRRALAALALTTDSSVLTSIANDFGYAEVFRRQVEALGNPGDMLIAISTSGMSENVCRAMEAALRLGLYGFAMVGGGGRLAELADSALCIPSTHTARVQEAHLFCGHVLCEMVENTLIAAQPITAPAMRAEQEPHARGRQELQ